YGVKNHRPSAPPPLLQRSPPLAEASARLPVQTRPPLGSPGNSRGYLPVRLLPYLLLESRIPRSRSQSAPARSEVRGSPLPLPAGRPPGRRGTLRPLRGR